MKNCYSCLQSSLIHKELSYKIIRLAMEVHNKLGILINFAGNNWNIKDLYYEYMGKMKPGITQISTNESFF